MPILNAKLESETPTRKTRKYRAFTLVELIVVITILAILATVGFLTLSGYTDDARSATVAANVRTVYSAILTESTTSGNSPRYYVDHDPAAALSGGIVFVDGGAVTLTGGQWGSGGTNYSAGNPKWDRLKMNGEKFRLSEVLRGLPGAFGVGGAGLAELAGAAYDTGAVSVGAFDYVGKAAMTGKSKAVSYFQVAGVSPGTKKASVTGNYTAAGTGAVLGLVDDPSSGSSTGAIVDSATVSGGGTPPSVACSGLPANAAYYGGATTYSVPSGTSTAAAYAATPAANTCQFSCTGSNSWNGSACTATNCITYSGWIYCTKATTWWTYDIGPTMASICSDNGKTFLAAGMVADVDAYAIAAAFRALKGYSAQTTTDGCSGNGTGGNVFAMDGGGTCSRETATYASSYQPSGPWTSYYGTVWYAFSKCQ